MVGVTTMPRLPAAVTTSAFIPWLPLGGVMMARSASPTARTSLAYSRTRAGTLVSTHMSRHIGPRFGCSVCDAPTASDAVEKVPTCVVGRSVPVGAQGMSGQLVDGAADD